jgi:hypothetical protein
MERWGSRQFAAIPAQKWSSPSLPAVKHCPVNTPVDLCNRAVHAGGCARPATTVITTTHFPLVFWWVLGVGQCGGGCFPKINLPLGGAEGGLILGASLRQWCYPA